MVLAKNCLLVVVMMVLTLAFSLEARPKDPRRERARCDFNLKLCKNVAATDYRHCVKARQSHCKENYDEDVGQCNTDYIDCLNIFNLNR